MRNRRIVLLGFVVALIGTATTRAQHPLLRCFESPINPNPQFRGIGYFVPADFDRDGLPDLICMTTAGQSLLFRNDGMTFAQQPWATIPFPLSDAFGNPCVADFNGDGQLDVFFPLWGQADVLLFGNGSGMFQVAPPGASPQRRDFAWQSVAADLTQTGRIDILKMCNPRNMSRGSRITRLVNQGGGVFVEAPNIIAITDEAHCVVGDVNRDGFPDLVIAGWSGPTRLLMNDGTGNFVPDTTGRLPALPGMNISLGACLGDINGDGHPDVLLAGCAAPTVTVFINDGTGRFTDQSATRLPALSQWCVRDALLADLDGDGDLDLVLACVVSLVGRGNVAFENVNGVFVNATDRWLTRLQWESWSVTAADIDGDADDDILFANTSGPTNNLGRAAIHRNLTRHLACTSTPQVGSYLRLDLYGRPGDVATLFVGSGVGLHRIPPFGNVFLPLGALAEVGTAAIGPTGLTHLGYLVPPEPTLAGATIAFQALIGPASSLLARRTTGYWKGVIQQ